MPLRRVRRAARRLADGDLSARVAEEGDAEPVELGRSFNAMASSLQQSRDELETQNAELAAQQGELEQALAELAAEKRRIDVFHRAGEQLAAELELDALAEIALRELCDAAGAEVGALYTADVETGPDMSLVATRGLDADGLAATCPRATDWPGEPCPSAVRSPPRTPTPSSRSSASVAAWRYVTS